MQTPKSRIMIIRALGVC